MVDVTRNSAILVSYVYYEKNTKRHALNLEFFLKEGYFRFKHMHTTSCPTDIYLSLNGGKCNVNLPPETDSFHILRRPNSGFDFGADADVLHHVRSKYGSIKNSPYTAFIFLNGSQRGPFLPVFWRRDQHWSTIFTDKLERGVGLVGSCFFYHHADKHPTVETWAFALRPDALQCVLEDGRVFVQHATKHEACVAEDRLTRVVVSNGFEFDSLQLKFARNKNRVSNNNGYAISSRPWSYEDISIHPLETVFYKTYWDSSAEKNENGYECPFEQRYTE